MTQSDHDLKQFYGSFKANHDQQRENLLRRLSENLPARAVGRRWLFTAALSGVAAMLLIFLAISMLPAGKQNLSWGQVLEHLNTVHTLTATIHTSVKDAQGKNLQPELEMNVGFRTPDQSWSESLSDKGKGARYLINATGHAGTMLAYQVNGIAYLNCDITFGRPSPEDDQAAANWLDQLRHIGAAGMKQERMETQNGRSLIRFEGTTDQLGMPGANGTAKVWVDQTSKLPVRLLVTDRQTPQHAPSQIWVTDMSDMSFDATLADEQFAWPEAVLQKTGIIQFLRICLSPDLSLEQSHLVLRDIDGKPLASGDDFSPTGVTLVNGAERQTVYALKPDVLPRITAYTKEHIGAKLKVEIVGAFDEIAIAGPVQEVSLLAKLKSAPTTQK